jgi:hypothetical protein
MIFLYRLKQNIGCAPWDGVNFPGQNVKKIAIEFSKNILGLCVLLSL